MVVETEALLREIDGVDESDDEEEGAELKEAAVPASADMSGDARGLAGRATSSAEGSSSY
jgi:hypothetical protein